MYRQIWRGYKSRLEGSIASVDVFEEVQNVVEVKSCSVKLPGLSVIEKTLTNLVTIFTCHYLAGEKHN